MTLARITLHAALLVAWLWTATPLAADATAPATDRKTAEGSPRFPTAKDSRPHPNRHGAAVVPAREAGIGLRTSLCLGPFALTRELSQRGQPNRRASICLILGG